MAPLLEAEAEERRLCNLKHSSIAPNGALDKVQGKSTEIAARVHPRLRQMALTGNPKASQPRSQPP